MSMDQAILWGVALPALVAGACIFIALTPWRRCPEGEARGRRGAALGIGLGYAAGHAAIATLPRFPAQSAAEWIFWLALAAALAAFVAAPAAENHEWRRGLFHLACAAAVPYLVLRSRIGNVWSPAEAIAWMAGLSALLFGLFGGVEALARRRRGAALPLILWVAASGASISLLQSSSGLLAQLAGALAATLGAAVVLAWWRPQLALDGGASTVALSILAAELIAGHVLGDLPAASALLLAAAPLAGWVMRAPPILYLAPWRSAILAAAAALGLAAAAAAISGSSSPGSP